MIIAHRGGVGGTQIRENTLKAFKRAFSLGIEGIEFDIHKTKDNKIIIHHSPNINGNKIADSLFSQLPKYVPLLEELFELIIKHDWWGLINIEVKAFGIMDEIHKVILKFPKLQNILITSFLHIEIDKAKKVFEDMKISFGKIVGCFPSDFNFAEPNLIMSKRSIPYNREEIKLLKNFRVFVFTVEPEDIKMNLDLGFNVFTNFI